MLLGLTLLAIYYTCSISPWLRYTIHTPPLNRKMPDESAALFVSLYIASTTETDPVYIHTNMRC